MSFAIEAIDGGTKITDSLGNINVFNSGEVRVNYHAGTPDKIALFSTIQSETIFKINLIGDVTSIDDNRSGGAGAIAVPANLLLLHAIIVPFFFSVGSTGGGGLDPWLLQNGNKNPASTFVTASLDYNPAASQEMLSDGTIHKWQNFFKQASSHPRPADSVDTTSLCGGTNDMDINTGLTPRNYITQIQSASADTREIISIVNNDTFSYGAFDNLYSKGGGIPDVVRSLGATGVNAQGLYVSTLELKGTESLLQRTAIDTSGNSYTSGITLHDALGTSFYRNGLDNIGNNYFSNLVINTEDSFLERSYTDSGGRSIVMDVWLLSKNRLAMQLLENGAAQEFGIYGTDSPFSEKVTRMLHVRGVGGVGTNELEIRDNSAWLRYKANVANSLRELRFSDADTYILRQTTGTNVKLGLVDTGGYSDGAFVAGASTHDASAILECVSTTKGFLPPKMTTVQRDAIVLPTEGIMLYNTTTKSWEGNSGTPAAPVWSLIG